MPLEPPPSLYEWAGGMSALEKLMDSFYKKVRQDSILAPLFAQMSEEHPRHVAHFVAEVLGGPALYSKERGGHPQMISRHLNRHLTQLQRARIALRPDRLRPNTRLKLAAPGLYGRIPSVIIQLNAAA